ncbi:MAG: VOC family protein [Gracilibacteraceae bacterium]|jgi:lactoylglutathione lyase|nr:VOC family protein [Gracilibacteraceae bacterium]
MNNKFRFVHNNINVTDLDRSLAFYREALGLRETGRRDGPNGDFTIVFLGDGVSDWRLELTWLRDHPQPYDLGENEIHFCLRAADYEAARAGHEAMGCVCFVNSEMGLYFINDPDGYWIEILPEGE